ncbi:hypothetical protein [Eisenbergiella sp.]|uniref:hypothetical protein n=1 Tax=Eisenbergiella sp. TaxID=1924109 RepID=UPI002A80F0BE|nr:hypothetical protein [Eisenbergiella sp.]
MLKEVPHFPFLDLAVIYGEKDFYCISGRGFIEKSRKRRIRVSVFSFKQEEKNKMSICLNSTRPMSGGFGCRNFFRKNRSESASCPKND